MRHFSTASRHLLLSICVFLCAACVETTSTQRNYTSLKEECQELSALKVGQFAPEAAGSEMDRQTLLVAEFKDCMKKVGWSVTGPDKEKLQQDTAAAPAELMRAAPLPPPVDTERVRRAAECAYARQAADHSSNARALAEACELECRSMRKMQPDAPLPAACAP